MKHGQSAPYTRFSVNSAPMIVGAVLIGAGSLIGLSGLIVGGTAMMGASRQWLRELQTEASDLASSKMGQTKAAAMSGPSAWQQRNDVQRTHA
jgi:hypothetical protein